MVTIPTPELAELRSLLGRRAPGVTVHLTRAKVPNTVHINLISVPASQRGYGMGDRVLNLICQTADARGWSLTLEPSSDLGSDLGRLCRWYSSAGFTPERRGRTMARTPRPFS